MHLLKKLALGACLIVATGPGATAQDKADPSTVVATVGDVEITLGHLAIARAGLPEQYQQLPASVLYDGLLDQLVQQTLLMQSIQDLPLHVDILLENGRRQIISSEALDVLLRAAVTEEAIQAAYDEEFAGFAPEPEFNASHILVETEEEAADILAKAQAGDDFAALAREFSTGPSGPNGGQLGWFGLGQMVPPFEEAVTAMEPGTVSGPVQTQFGWHVIRLNDARQSTAPSLEEVRGDLIANLERDLAQSEIAKLYDAATITIVPDVDPTLILDPDIFEN